MVQERKKPSSLILLHFLGAAMVVLWSPMTEITASSPHPLRHTAFMTLPATDVMFTDDVLWQTPARSKVECSVMCRGEGRCRMFTFLPGEDGPPGNCRCHGKRQAAQGQQKSVPGARSFGVVIGDVWIQKNCSNSSSNCTEPKAACFSGQCLCDGGFFFDYFQNACVSACSGSFGHTYLRYPNMVLYAHYVNSTVPNGNVSTCMSTCDADPLCTNFAHRLQWNRCFYKHVTAQDYPQDWTQGDSVVHYQKTCV